MLMINAFPIFLVLPTSSATAAAAYDASGLEVGNVSSSVLAVYFSLAGGGLVFTANKPTVLDYVAIKSSWKCAGYFVSTSPYEQWSASKTKGNFSLDNNQDICLFHVANNITEVAGSYDIEMSFDFLYYQYSGSASVAHFYTGTGIFSDVSDRITVFRWSSDANTVSKSFAVQLSSSSSSFPYRNSRGSGTSLAPILLTAERIAPSHSRSRDGPQKAHLAQPGEPGPLAVGSLAAISALVAMTVLGLCLAGVSAQ
jgi:hypothetical protein